jgi:hypothetical protein
MEGSRPRGAFVAGRARKVLEAGGVAEVGARPTQVGDPNRQPTGGRRRRQRVPFFFLISIASQRCLCAGVLKFAIGCNLQIGSSAAILRDHSEKALFLRLFHDFLDFSPSTSKVSVLASHDKIHLRRVTKT